MKHRGTYGETVQRGNRRTIGGASIRTQLVPHRADWEREPSLGADIGLLVGTGLRNPRARPTADLHGPPSTRYARDLHADPDLGTMISVSLRALGRYKEQHPGQVNARLIKSERSYLPPRLPPDTIRVRFELMPIRSSKTGRNSEQPLQSRPVDDA
ncbi:hypothetical protein R1flu_010129 [Riccia fluitans]|uniref:Uncharacterized protein n=1 Tax=Riccia fluitans TaxID=41844 RepID=A0ABD1Z8B5_9MARC